MTHKFVTMAKFAIGSPSYWVYLFLSLPTLLLFFSLSGLPMNWTLLWVVIQPAILIVSVTLFISELTRLTSHALNDALLSKARVFQSLFVFGVKALLVLFPVLVVDSIIGGGPSIREKEASLGGMALLGASLINFFVGGYLLAGFTTSLRRGRAATYAEALRNLISHAPAIAAVTLIAILLNSFPVLVQFVFSLFHVGKLTLAGANLLMLLYSLPTFALQFSAPIVLSVLASEIGEGSAPRTSD